MSTKELVEQEASLISAKFQSAYKRGAEICRVLSDLMTRGGHVGFVSNSNFVSYFETHFAPIIASLTNMVESINLNDFGFAQTLCRRMCEDLSHSLRDAQNVLIRIEANINDKPILIQIEELNNCYREFKTTEIQLDKLIFQLNQLL